MIYYRQFVILVFISSQFICHGQISWCDLPAVPNKNGVIFFNNSSSGWLINHRSEYPKHFGMIHRTNDGARTWVIDQELHIASYGADGRLSCIAMADTLTGWIGGKTQRTIGEPILPLLLKRGWVPGTVGIQWHRQEVPIPEGNQIHALWVFDSKHVVFGTSKGLVVESRNGGASWIILDTLPQESSIQRLQFVDSLTGWIKSWDALYKTTDGGKSWKLQDYGTAFGLNTMHFVDSNHGWIAGQTGVIRHTNNGGNSWVDQWSTTGAAIYSMVFFNNLSGIAVGGRVYDDRTGRTLDSARILHTWDGGDTWQQLAHPKDRILTQIFMMSADSGFVIGDDVLYRYCGKDVTGVIDNLETTSCEPLYYDMLGNLVERSDNIMLIEYHPCTHTSRLIVIQQ